jgi:hypothetical protein
MDMQHKPLSLSALLLGSVSFSITLLSAQPAFAGFQWVSPDVAKTRETQQTSYPSYSSAQDAPSIIQGSGGTAYVPLPRDEIVMRSDLTAAAVAPSGGAARSAVTPEAIPMIAPDMASRPTAMTLSRPVAQDSDQKIVAGFADNVPLSVALRQVLPESIGFSAAQDVSLDTAVSWQGGDAWRSVLGRMLQPANLTYKETGRMVHIVRSAGGGLMAPPALEDRAREVDARMGGERPVSLLAQTPRSASSYDPAPSSGKYLVPPMGSAPVVSSVSYGAPSYQGQAVSDVWFGGKGETLRGVLRKWADRAGVDLSWQSEHDFPLQASVSFPGSFQEAARLILIGFENAEPQPYGELFSNQSAGQSVLVIRTRGNKKTD